MRAPVDCGVMDIVLEFPDTKVIGTLVLPGTDLRLYEWEEGSRGLSERGRQRGGAVAAQAARRQRYSAAVLFTEGRRKAAARVSPGSLRKPETIIVSA